MTIQGVLGDYDLILVQCIGRIEVWSIGVLYRTKIFENVGKNVCISTPNDSILVMFSLSFYGLF